jgi:hypothetical protein
VVDWRPIPFYIRPIDERSLDVYAKSVARTLILEQRHSNARDGEVLVTVTKRSRSKELSVHPKHLVPWEPVVGGDVIVIAGACLGNVGVAKEKKDKIWVVTFTVDDVSVDWTFEEKDLAGLDVRN